jgi:hypothetical protein
LAKVSRKEWKKLQISQAAFFTSSAATFLMALPASVRDSAGGVPLPAAGVAVSTTGSAVLVRECVCVNDEALFNIKPESKFCSYFMLLTETNFYHRGDIHVDI